MFRILLVILLFFSLLLSDTKEDILNVLEEYNKAFSKADYSKIITYFDYPVSFNLIDKTITASNRFKLRLIYKKIRGGLHSEYSYSKWDEINIELIDNKLAIVNAVFSRYNHDNVAFESGAAQYYLRLQNNEWKFFSLTPYKNIITLN